MTTLAGTYSYANETPNIVYELLLGGVLTATLVPLVREALRGGRRRRSVGDLHRRDARAPRDHRGRGAGRAVDRASSTPCASSGRERRRAAASSRPTLLRLFMPQMLFYGIVTLATAMLNARTAVRAPPRSRRSSTTSSSSRCSCCSPASPTATLTVQRVLDDDALDPAHRAGHHGRHRGDGARAAPAAASFRTSGCASCPRSGTPPCARCCGCPGGRSATSSPTRSRLLVVTDPRQRQAGGPFVYMSAYAFFQLPHGLFAVSFMTTFAPELATAGVRGDLDALRDAAVARASASPIVVIVPAAAMYLGLARPIVVALLQRGAFSRRRRGDGRRHARRVRGRPAAVLRLSLRAARVHVTPRHVHAVLAQLHRERGEHRARVPAVRVARHPRARARVLARVLRGRGAHALACSHRRLRRHRRAPRSRPPRSRTVLAGGAVAAVHVGRGGGRSAGRAPARRCSRRSPARSPAAVVYLALLALLRVEELSALSARSHPPGCVTGRATRATIDAERARRTIGHTDRRGPVGIRVVTDSSCDLPQPLVRGAGHRDRAAHHPLRRRGVRRPGRAEHRRVLGAGRSSRAPARDRRAVAGRVRGRASASWWSAARPASCASTCRRTSRARCSRRRSRRRRSSTTCPVQVIDSQSASMGLGNLCLTAARRAADGDSLGVDRRRGRRPARPHQALRDPRHARPHPQERPRRQRPRAARHRCCRSSR